MSHLGVGVMLGMFSDGGKTSEAVTKSVGKVISDIKLVNEFNLELTFVDNTTLRLWDNGQSCCEHRYMVAEDDLSYFIGSSFMTVEVVSANGIAESYNEHEIQFLNVTTSKGVFQMSSHNVHNGYYGGFNIVAELIEK